MFDVGDVVRFHSPTAGKEKFHLCVGQSKDGPLFAFLHLNSNSGYAGDYVLQDGRITGLPKSTTGKTVVSFSMVVRLGEERLKKFGAAKTGAIDRSVGGELLAFAERVPTLTRDEKILVIGALEEVVRKPE